MEKPVRRIQPYLFLLPFLDPVFPVLFAPFLKLLVHSAFFLLSAFLLSLAAPVRFLLLSVQFVSDLHLKDKKIKSKELRCGTGLQGALPRLGETPPDSQGIRGLLVHLRVFQPAAPLLAPHTPSTLLR